MPDRYKVGQPIVFNVTKRSPSPGPRAQDVEPEPLGEDYEYHVDKFWVVAEVREDGKLLAKTRRGKEHLIDPNHPNLRKPNIWERLVWSHKFPKLDQIPRDSSQSTEQPG